MRQHFEDFVEDLQRIHGDNLRSVVLYGSAASGDFIPFGSDYNILVALEQITPEDLRNSHSVVREWVRLGHPVPAYFTVTELVSMGDVFPIELHFMERARKVLYGEDVLADIEISDTHLRHQVEYELRSHLLRLRRRYIEASTSSRKLTDLMARSVKSFAAVFRALMLLYGEEPPVRKVEVLAATCKMVGFESATFEKVLAIRKNGEESQMDVTAANDLFADYLKDIEAVIAAVDDLDRD